MTPLPGLGRSFLAVVLAWVCWAGYIQAQGLSPTGEAFVKDAQQGSKGEIVLGRLAADKAGSEAVKAFGERMIKDHSQANKELLEIADRERVALDNALSAEHQQVSDELSKLSGADFDGAYIDAMVEDHEKDIAKFETAAQTLPDREITAFAQKTLPILKEHLQLAERIRGQLKESSSRARQ